MVFHPRTGLIAKCNEKIWSTIESPMQSGQGSKIMFLVLLTACFLGFEMMWWRLQYQRWDGAKWLILEPHVVIQCDRDSPILFQEAQKRKHRFVGRSNKVRQLWFLHTFILSMLADYFCGCNRFLFLAEMVPFPIPPLRRTPCPPWTFPVPLPPRPPS